MISESDVVKIHYSIIPVFQHSSSTAFMYSSMIKMTLCYISSKQLSQIKNPFDDLFKQNAQAFGIFGAYNRVGSN